MSKTTLQQLADFGQSVWLDFINRPLLETGELKKLIALGLRGMTSNPSIFNQAIGSSNDYDNKIRELKEKGKSTFEIYDELTIRDIQEAADHFKGVYEKTNRLDGYVSLEINPLLAQKVDEQAKEGVRLFKKVNRPNVMIKVPSTDQGFPVIEQLIGQGINVNITLIFSLRQYEKTAQAYFNGLKHLQKNKENLKNVHSVASVFVSRVDTSIDKLLDEMSVKESNAAKKEQLQILKGKAAVANCRLIFERFKELFATQEFKDLQSQGANLQRVLWGSTSTKNPAYPDIKYVTELIAHPTVNTLPKNTLEAFLDHGKIQDAFKSDKKDAQEVITSLQGIGIDVNKICLKLLEEGCLSFNQAFETLMSSIEKKVEKLSFAK